MTVSCALGLTRAAGRIDDIGKIRFTDVVGKVLPIMRFDLVIGRELNQPIFSMMAQPRRRLPLMQHHLGPTVVQHERQAIFRIVLVQRKIGTTSLQYGQ